MPLPMSECRNLNGIVAVLNNRGRKAVGSVTGDANLALAIERRAAGRGRDSANGDPS